MSPLKRFLFGVLGSGLAFGGASLLAHELQARARASSHEQPPWPGLPIPSGAATSEALSTAGRKLFLDSCAHCHGADARGDEGPDLHALDVSDRRIATVIRIGIKGEMPSFAKKLSPEQTAELIAYLRRLE